MPRQLPAPVRQFTGRQAELGSLAGLLDLAGATPGPVLITAIGGMAGVGKTALAVHWAHQVADRFPDGQLFVDLRGFGPSDRPMAPAEAIRGMLDALGVPAEQIPAGLDAQAGMYRSLLAGKRMLVLLDNARDAGQVRPLLPGGRGCLVLATSRDALAGLTARGGAVGLELGLLPLAEASALLGGLIGSRAGQDPDATGQLAILCGRLPLALRVAAELATARPDAPLAVLASELADQRRRLDLLEAGGDLQTAVRAVFSWSYRRLSPDLARVFRLLGLCPGSGPDTYAAAALTGTAYQHASTVLGQLTRAHLIQQPREGCYTMHDLLRTYAGELAGRHDSAQERQAALTRLLDYYLHTAAAAMDVLYPAERGRRPPSPAPAPPAPPLTSPAVAGDWLDLQRASLVAATAYAAGNGWPDHASRLAAVLFRYLETGGHAQAGITVHTHALRAARDAGDRAAEASALTHLGSVLQGQGHHQQARQHLVQALAVFQAAGDRLGEARTLGNLGQAELAEGRYPQAAGQLRQALALYRDSGDQLGEACTLSDLGTITMQQGRYRPATAYQQQALTLCRQTGYRLGEAYALHNLGCLSLRQGRHQPAIDQLTSALALHRETSCRPGETEALNDLGEALLAAGRPGDARVQHTAALGLASQTGNQHQQACAHHGLGRVCQALHDPAQAQQHWHRALSIYTRLGLPEADQVRADLAAADGHRLDDPNDSEQARLM